MKPASSLDYKLAALRCADYLNHGVSMGLYKGKIPYSAVKKAIDQNIKYYAEQKRTKIDFDIFFEELSKSLKDLGLEIEPLQMPNETLDIPLDDEDMEDSVSLPFELDIYGEKVLEFARWLTSISTCEAPRGKEMLKFKVSVVPCKQGWVFEDTLDE